MIFAIATMGLSLFAQAPQGINHQTVVSDGDGQLLADATVSLRMTILSGTASGTPVYSETHTKVTNKHLVINPENIFFNIHNKAVIMKINTQKSR